MNTYIILSSILFLFLGVVWSHRNMLDASLKVIFFCLSFYGGLLIIHYKMYLAVS